jgi:hypothetical protein
MRSGRTVAGLVTVAVLLAGAGCSSDDDGDASPLDPEQAETDGGSAETETGQEDVSGDQAVADATVFVLDDFPVGWRQEPAPAEDPVDQQMRDALAGCLGVEVTDIEPDHPSADSPRFVGPDDSQVSNSTTVAPSVEEAERLFDVMTSDEVPGCYAQAIQSAVDAGMATPSGPAAQDVSFGQPTVSPTSFPAMGDESVALHLLLPIITQGQTVDVHTDVVLVRIGRTLVSTDFQTTFSPYVVADVARITQALVDRAPAG